PAMSARPTRWIATAVVAAVVWFATGALEWPARLWCAMLLVLLPALAIVQAALIEGQEHEIPRSAAYLSSAAAIWALAGISVIVALASGFSTSTLGLRGDIAAVVTWSAAALAAGLAILAAGRALGVRESVMLRRILPRSAREKWAFAALSISAGIGEELAFRGFLVPALELATGSTVLALVLSSGAFGMLHGYQAAAGIARAALLGLVLALSFVLSGSLLPAIIAHALLDIIAGIWAASWLLR
ncbi:MAG: CPBP family intramembrane glutamic endopeptidase, partial [Longimicrobiales bacterium]